VFYPVDGNFFPLLATISKDIVADLLLLISVKHMLYSQCSVFLKATKEWSTYIIWNVRIESRCMIFCWRCWMPSDSNPQERCSDWEHRVRKTPRPHHPPEDLEPRSPTLAVSAKVQTHDLCTTYNPNSCRMWRLPIRNKNCDSKQRWSLSLCLIRVHFRF